MRCGLYARFSTEKQTETSISDQFRVCREYAELAGWAVVMEHSDQGISGAALGNRPGVRAIQLAAIAGEIDAIVVTDLTRLSRSQGDLLKFIERLKFRRVEVIGVQDGYHSGSRTARIQAGLSGIMSEEFRAMIADRTRSALQTRAREGRSTGGRVYGYRDGQPEIVREIFARSAAGVGMKTIAADLNARGIPSPGADWTRLSRAKHGRWLASALHAILHNERYVGRLTWNRSQWIKDPDSGRRVRRQRPRSEWVTQQIQPLIDEATWSAVQNRLRPARKGRGGAPRYLLSGLMSCAVCGSKYIIVGGRQHRYGCGTNHAGGEHACSNRMTVPRKTAERHILAPVMADMLAPQSLNDAYEEARAVQADERTPEDGEIAELQRMVHGGLISSATAQPAIEEARRRAQERRDSRGQTQAERLGPQAWARVVAGMREILEGEDIDAARAVLRELLGEVRMIPTEDHLIAELTARQIMLCTGSGRWIGSGGRI